MFAASKTAGAVSAEVNYIEDVFSTYLYTGNSSTQTITNGIDLSTKGGLVWLKVRNQGARDHWLQDTARGITNTLNSNTTGAQNALSSNIVSSVTTTGFVDNASWPSGWDVASWTFRKQPKFFDVVTYTGDGGTQNIAHSLGSTPGCIIVKRTNTTGSWRVFHTSVSTQYGNLNSTAAFQTTSAENVWGNNSTTVAPTSTQFTVGNDSSVNASGSTYVAYLFAHNAGGFGLTGTDNVISCGSFTAGTGSVNLGYEPQWIMFKGITGSNEWIMFDTMRGWPTEAPNKLLMAESSAAEGDTYVNCQPTATGFKYNFSPDCIYIAIRRGPMKVPTSGTSVFLPTSRTGNASLTTITSGFAPDVVLSRRVDNLDNGNESVFADKLRGSGTLSTNNTAAEYAGGATSGLNSYTNTGIVLGTNNNPIYAFNYATLPYATYQFQRAPSFFDEVCYTGTGSATTFTHNLGAVPELMIVKNRSSAGYGWLTYSATLGATKYLQINSTAAEGTVSTYWNNTAPTSSVFSVGTAGATNASGDTFVAYLFATCAGVSKVGSYTGNGSTQTINCGFTGGARFVLIKRTDSTGDWYVYDTARGMTTLTDPYVLLNSTAAQTATLGSVTTVSTGFAVNASILAAINTNAASYIFLAIA